MSRRPARFTQADVVRAIKAAEQAAKPMAIDILPDGTIRLTPAAGVSSRDLIQDELDREIAEFRARAE